MPTNRRKIARRRADAYTRHHLEALSTGLDIHCAFAPRERRTPEWRAAREERMRAAWPILREAVFRYHHERGREGLPWGWWNFESPEPRNCFEPEAEQLARLGIDRGYYK